MLTLSNYVVLTLVFTHSSCYTLVGPKLYGQSLPTSSRGWSNIVPYPFRAYPPSIPVQYYGRYFGDPYFTHNLQNPDYYYTQDPYSPSFDDSDYYSNFLYYIPTAGRRMSYYDPAMMESMDEMQDYDEDPAAAAAPDDGISKSQREWWLEKNVAPNEDIDFGQLNQVNDRYGQTAKTSKKQKSKAKESRKTSRNRYAGIDGFGRKKDKEQVFGNFRPSQRKEEERTWVYGVPVRSEHEDRDVEELRSLLKSPNVEEHRFGDARLDDWASGNAKRSVSSVKKPEAKENSSLKGKFETALKPTTLAGPFSVYDEGGKEEMPEAVAEANSWTSNYIAEEPSVFDTIKKLLALEDKMNQVSQDVHSHKMLKRKQSKNREKERVRHEALSTSSETATTMKRFPSSDQHALPVETTTRVSVSQNQKKRSISSKQPPVKSIYTDEDSLVRQLSDLRHRTS